MAYVQKVSANADGASSITPVLTGVTAGNTLALIVGSTDTTGGVASWSPPSDSSGQTWAKAVGPNSVNSGPADPCKIAIYYLLSANAGAHNLTLSAGSSQFFGYTLVELPPCTAVDVTTSNSGTSGVTSGNTGTTGSTAQANEVVLVGLVTNTSGAGLSNSAFSDPASSGFTSLFVEQNTTAHVGSQHSYKEVSATGAQTGSWTWSSGAQTSWMAVIATFKLAAGAIGQVTETDAAQSVSLVQTAIAQASENDAAQPFGAADVAQFGDLFVFGDDTGNESSMGGLRVLGGFIVASSVVGIGQVTETDLAQVIVAKLARLLGQPSESDTAQAFASAQAKAVGQPAESDLAQVLTSAQRRAIGQGSETDSAQAVTLGGAGAAIGQASEADAAQTLTAAQRKAVGQSAETDTAQQLAVVQARTAGQAIETDLAQAATGSQRKAVGQVLETDLAQAVGGAGALVIGQSAEIDVAQAVAGVQRLAVGQPAETDAAQALSKAIGRAIGQSVETDLAQSVAKSQRLAIAQVVEVDAAIALGAGSLISIGQPVETDAAQTVQRRLVWQMGLAAETDQAVAVISIGGEPIAVPGQRSERVGISLSRSAGNALRRPTGTNMRRT